MSNQKSRIMKALLAGFFCLFFLPISNAQLEKVIHQTFEIANAAQINLDLVGEYTIVLWPGNKIMTETRIQLFGGSPAILNHFLEEEKRYEVDMEADETTIKLSSHDKERNAIRTKIGECTEVVRLRIFIPEEFDKLNETTLVRPTPASNGE